MDMNSQDDQIVLNGISGTEPGYLVAPFTLEELRDRAHAMKLSQGEAFGDPDHLAALKSKGDPAGQAFILPPDAEPENLETTGWGMIFPASAEPGHVSAILEALSELIELRQGQAGARFRIFKDSDGYRPGESADAFVGRHGLQPGTPDVDKVPYYLLIVSDPQSIPFYFQYELDVQFGVGRIYFETLDEYASYARSVKLSETPGQINLPRQVALFGVANEDDQATQLSAQSLIGPLYDYILKRHEKVGWNPPARVEPSAATKANLARLLGGDQAPALLFTASHGLGWPRGHPFQIPFQGALVCQDWPGPSLKTAPTRDMYFGAEDLDESASLLGRVAFFFACFGAGTPYVDDYALAQNKARQALAHRAFLAALPRRMLAHPRGGALAVIGHVERAWGYSFRWQGTEAEPESFKFVLYQIMKGIPVGHAMEHLNVRYAQIASMLSGDFEEVRANPRYDARKLAFHWLASNDARGYAILGDPAVKIPLAEKGAAGLGPGAMAQPDQRAGSLPVILVLDSLPEIERSFVESEIASQTPAPSAPGESPTPGEEAGRSTPPAERHGVPAGAPVAAPPPGVGAPAGPPPASAPYASAMDGLAFALQAYSGEGSVSFSAGLEGVQFNILDDAKNAVQGVVQNLNNALKNLSERLLKATDEALKLEVTTSLVEDLDAFDPGQPGVQKPRARFKTTISATGDIQVFLPNRAEAIDQVLLQVHKDMVEQAMTNRMETVKAIGELVASLFSPQK